MVSKASQHGGHRGHQQSRHREQEANVGSFLRVSPASASALSPPAHMLRHQIMRRAMHPKSSTCGGALPSEPIPTGITGRSCVAARDTAPFDPVTEIGRASGARACGSNSCCVGPPPPKHRLAPTRPAHPAAPSLPLQLRQWARHPSQEEHGRDLFVGSGAPPPPTSIHGRSAHRAPPTIRPRRPAWERMSAMYSLFQQFQESEQGMVEDDGFPVGDLANHDLDDDGGSDAILTTHERPTILAAGPAAYVSQAANLARPRPEEILASEQKGRLRVQIAARS
jgi:hypothetical protein